MAITYKDSADRLREHFNEHPPSLEHCKLMITRAKALAEDAIDELESVNEKGPPSLLKRIVYDDYSRKTYELLKLADDVTSKAYPYGIDDKPLFVFKDYQCKECTVSDEEVLDAVGLRIRLDDPECYFVLFNVSRELMLFLDMKKIATTLKEMEEKSDKGVGYVSPKLYLSPDKKQVASFYTNGVCEKGILL